MADRLDVAGRLAEGLPAVEHTQRYVGACQMLGYQHPDLTSRPTQIRDWYDSEDGLDLRALDNDCAQLRAAAAALTEVLRMQRAQIGELTAAWTGPAADAAVWFLQRHCDAASMVATEVRAAAQRCEALRDNLWHLVDLKVATAIGIDDRTLTRQSAWLAAADVVTIGVGDRQTAAEVVQQQIKPYVDNDIRDEWLTAMRSTRAGVAASYGMVTDRFSAVPAASFEIPSDLGPDRQLRPSGPLGPPARPSAPATTAAVAPVATLPSLPPDPVPLATATFPTQELGTSLGDAPAMNPGVGSAAGLDGLSGLGGLSGLANRIVESMGGLLGSGAEQLADEDPFGEDRFDKDPFDKGITEHEDKEDDEDEEDDKDHEDAKALPPEGAPPAGLPPAADLPPPANQPPLAVTPPADAAGPPATVPPTTGPAPVRGSPPSGGSTPCEIAADQVPQAGG